MNFFRNESFFSSAPASYAQARIYFDEQTRFHPQKAQVAIHNMAFLYRLSTGGTLLITQLRQALQLVVMKHQSLRTSLLFDTDNEVLMQQIVDTSDDNNKLFTFAESTFETDEELEDIMYDERGNPNHLDLARGLVFRCHLVHHKQNSHNNLLREGDAIIFNFHHALFDLPSIDVFVRDLDQAYTIGKLSGDDGTTLRYLDCKCYFLFSSFELINISVILRCRGGTTNAYGCRWHLLA
jgi:hypothetical protein